VSIPLGARSLEGRVIHAIAPTAVAGEGELAPLLHRRHVDEAARAVERGAFLLIDESLDVDLPGWRHPFAAWALAELLDSADAPETPPAIAKSATIGVGAVILPRVRIGERVVVQAGAIVGAAGFGWARGPEGKMRAIPQLGGVVIEDDVFIGAGATIAGGTLAPTIVRRGAKLDAQVHVAHNCDVGEGTMIAAQSGLAGSVVVGKGVLMGGQVGIADHVVIGDGARIAAKSGVIGDVPPGATYAGYPAMPRVRWLRAIAASLKNSPQRPQRPQRKD